MILLAASLPSLTLALAAGAAPQAPATALPGPLPREALQLPMTFVENAGQWDTPARFVASMGETLVWIEDDGFVVVTQADEGEPSLPLRFDFVGASDDARPAGAERRPGLRNYFVGNDPERWRSGVLGYAEVVYPELYEGVELRLREAGGLLEYDLHLAPGADLSSVVVRCEGVEALEIDEQGGLLMETAQGVLRQTPPRTWCVLPSGEQQPLECEFVVHDATRYGFRLAEHDPDLPVVIDPGLEWATYLGGSQWEYPYGMVLRPSGEIVVAGLTFSPNFPPGLATIGSSDAFVSVLDSSGSTLLYSTLLGGAGQDDAIDVQVGPGGEVFLVGTTSSSDFPVTQAIAYQPTLQGDFDAFVVELSPDLGTIVYCSYLGGSKFDMAQRLLVRSPRVLTIAGLTRSIDFPISPGTAYQASWKGVNDYFLCRLDLDQPPASQLLYGTYLGGGANEGQTSSGPGALDLKSLDLHEDASGVVTLAGGTFSWDIPTTPNGYDTTFDGITDCYLAIIDPSQAGSKGLVYATFVGGGDRERALALAVDSAGVVTLGGRTQSVDFPTTPGAHSTTFLGPTGVRDGFILRLDPSQLPQDQLLYGTFLAGDFDEQVTDLTLDAGGKVVAQGYSGPWTAPGSNSFPTTCGAYDTGFGGASDGFVLYLDPAGNGVSDLLYSTFVGSDPGYDLLGFGLAIVSEAPTLKTVSCGLSASPNFPVTSGAYQQTTGGLGDVILLQLEINPHTYCAAAPNSAGPDGAIICGSGSVSIADNAFTLSVAGGPPNNVGLFVYGATAAKTPFGDGWLCLSSPVFRILPTFFLDPSGNASRPLDFTQPPFSSGPGAITPGSTWYFQLWYRDPAGGPAGYNLSNGLKATFYP